MAVLKGKGAMTGVNLVARSYDSSVTQDGRTRYLDVMVDHRDQRGADQTNLHLTSQRVIEDNRTTFNNSAGYRSTQFDKIVEAAGDNTTPLLNKNGEKVGTIYGLKADLMPSPRGSGLLINTNKDLQASDFAVDGTTIDEMFVSMAQAKDARAAAQAAAPAAEPEATAEADVAIHEVAEPAVG